MDGTQGGFLHMIPVFFPDGMTTTSISNAMLPWISPSYSGVVGVTLDNPPEPVIAVTFEWPMSWLRTIQEIPKFDREVLYIRRFSADQALATGTHALSNVLPGANPPDTVVTTDNGVLGIESTSFTVENRRGVYSLFRLLRRRILEQDPTAFAKLAGYMVYVWFEEAGTAGLAQPFRRNDSQAVMELLQELANYEPQAEQMRVPPGPLPQQAPTPPIVSTARGARFYAVPLQVSAPSSMLFTFTGFELGLAYTSLVTARAVWNEVQRLVNDHDQAGVDILLITAGAPDQRGDIFPAEEAIGNFMLDNPIGLDQPPGHIKQVWFHSWMTGRATALYPNIEPMFGPLYQSLVPLHHPLVATRDAPTSDAAESSASTNRDATAGTDQAGAEGSPITHEAAIDQEESQADSADAESSSSQLSPGRAGERRMLSYVLEPWPQVFGQLDSPAVQFGEPWIALELWCNLN